MKNFVLTPLQGGASIPLDKAIVFFGRGSECDVVLTNSRKVSRKHCCVSQIDHRIVIRDLGSMNGVRINEQMVQDEENLEIGDVLWVGDLGFRLEQAGAMGLKAPPIVRKVPIPSKKKSKSSSERNISELEPEANAPVRKRSSSPVRSISADQRGTQPEEEIIQLSESDILDAQE